MRKTVRLEHNPDAFSYPKHEYVTPYSYRKIRRYLQARNCDWDGSPHTFVIITHDLDAYEGTPLEVNTCGAFNLPRYLTCHILEMWTNPEAHGIPWFSNDSVSRNSRRH